MATAPATLRSSGQPARLLVHLLVLLRNLAFLGLRLRLPLPCPNRSDGHGSGNPPQPSSRSGLRDEGLIQAVGPHNRVVEDRLLVIFSAPDSPFAAAVRWKQLKSTRCEQLFRSTGKFDSNMQRCGPKQSITWEE